MTRPSSPRTTWDPEDSQAQEDSKALEGLLRRYGYSYGRPCPKKGCRLPSIPSTGRRGHDGYWVEFCPQGHPVPIVDSAGPRAPTVALERVEATAQEPGHWRVILILVDE